MSNLCMPRKTKQSSPVGFYLGGEDEKKERRKRLDEVAITLGMNANEMLRAIADGDLVVVPRAKAGVAATRPSLNGQPIKVGQKVEVVTTYKTQEIEIPAGQRGKVQDWKEDLGGWWIKVLINRSNVWLPAPFLKLSE